MNVDKTDARAWSPHPAVVGLVFFCVCFTAASLLDDAGHRFLGLEARTNGHKYGVSLLTTVLWMVGMRLWRGASGTMRKA